MKIQTYIRVFPVCIGRLGVGGGGRHTMASLNNFQQKTLMYIVGGELNDGNSSKFFFILMQL